VRKITGMLRAYFHGTPEQLDDDEWAKQWNELKWLLKNGHPYFTTNGKLI